MPKIIENLRAKIIQEAKDQIAINGYESVTIRNIAKGCEIGLGTFYNYFKSKDMLIATFLLEDWKGRMSKISEEYANEVDPMAVVRALNFEVSEFIKEYNSIFTSPLAIKSFNTTSMAYHRFVRDQVAAPIKNTLSLAQYENAEFLALFVAEAVVTWTVAKRDYDEIEAVVSKLFVK